MSGCTHMAPGEFCAACAPEKLRGARAALEDAGFYQPALTLAGNIGNLLAILKRQDGWREERLRAERERAEALAVLRGAMHELSLIEADTQRGVTDCSTPVFQRVRNIVEMLRRAESERDGALGAASVLKDERDEARAKYADALTVLGWMGAWYNDSGDLTIHPRGWNAEPDVFEAWKRIRANVEAKL